MNNLLIVPYSEKHRSLIVEWLADLQDIERAALSTRRPGKDMAEDYFTQTCNEVTENKGAILVAEIGGGPVGFISYFPERADDITLTAEANFYGYVTDVYVAADFRGTGVFQALMAKAIEHLKTLGVKSIKLNVVAKNERAYKAYLKEGFTPEEISLRKEIK